MNPLSPDTQAILLLCGHFGNRATGATKPLTPSEYAWFAQWLKTQQLRPADLFTIPITTFSKQMTIHKTITLERLTNLLQRGGTMALAAEVWMNKGIWVMSRSDKTYPMRLKKQLGQQAPPLFYGVGTLTSLQYDGIAVVGSRQPNKSTLEFTQILAKKSAQQHLTLISGGARGVDTEAMLTALAHGGMVVGILADNLAKTAMAKEYREALQEGRLTLLSPFEPNMVFNVGNAMARNKYIYALAKWAIIVNCQYEKGGTWAGAMENLKAQRVPLLVAKDEQISEGNQQLIKLGGIPLEKNLLQTTTDLRQQLTQLASVAVREKANRYNIPSAVTPIISERVDLFEIIWPSLEPLLMKEQSVRELAQHLLHVTPKQLEVWLKHAVELGKLKKLKNPIRYVKVTHQENWQLTLFS